MGFELEPLKVIEGGKAIWDSCLMESTISISELSEASYQISVYRIAIKNI